MVGIAGKFISFSKISKKDFVTSIINARLKSGLA